MTNSSNGVVPRLATILHKNFLWLMIGSYAVAALAPWLGLWIRDTSVGSITLFGQTTRVSLSMVMLASMLLNAGLGVELRQLGAMLRKPGLLVAGLSANLVIPILFILVSTRLIAGWHSADEVQNILVGLALVASMPIAGSSTAWAQNADGELSLSLGMVLFSTLLSPITTPLALHSVGLMTTGDYSEDLHELASGVTGTFLAICVLAPSVLGIGLRRYISNRRYQTARPKLKLMNMFILLLLNYSNASVSLPQAVADPDPDFLILALGMVTVLCLVAFAAGGLIARLMQASPSQRTSLMFGLGMNNNGTGLVLASMALADHPRVMLPIIFYNLVQHLAAGAVDRICVKEQAPHDQPIVERIEAGILR